MSTFATVISFLLGLAFLAAGGTKLAAMDPHPAEFARYDLPGATADQARLGVGAIEVLAAVLLVFGGLAGSSGLAVVGALIFLLTMLGALATHLRLSDSPPRMTPPAVLGVLAIVLLVAA